MPVLSLEPTLFPEQLLDEPTFGPAPGSLWWVAHTKPRAEKMLARHLMGRSVPFFLPVYSRRSRRRNQLSVSYLPLFPGYLFLHADEESRREALKTNYTVRTIEVVDQQQLHTELCRVHRMMVSGAALAPEERLQPGEPVEIASGPLKGLQGKIIRRGNQQKFVVEVDFLRRGASVELDGWLLKPLGGTPTWSPAPGNQLEQHWISS